MMQNVFSRIQDMFDFGGPLTDTYVMTWSASGGKFIMSAVSGGGAGTPPAGSSGQLQFNNAGAFGGAFTWDSANSRAGIGTTTPLGPLDVRSGTGFADLGPINMTGDSAPSPLVASASTEINGSNQAWGAFCNLATANGWLSSAVPAWLQIDLGSGNATIFTAYTIQTESGSAPTAWIVAGSNDGSTFTTLDTQTSQSLSAGVPKLYSYSNTTAYRYYRITVSASTGSIVQIHDLKYGQIGASIVAINGNVGIGSLNPKYPLDIAGTINHNSGIQIRGFVGSNAAGWIEMAAAPLIAGIGISGNPWIASVPANALWFTDALAGDIAYRNVSGALRFGTSAGTSNISIVSGTVSINGAFAVTSAGLAGMFGATPVGRQTVSGSRASGAALVSLIAALVALGSITDSTTT